VANQYTAQMMQEVKDAVFGNVGSIISFRTSADDARIMMKYFEPKFEEHDLVHMHNRHFAVSMTIGGEKVPAFSAISLNLPPFTDDYSAQIIAHSRSQYAQSRSNIERYVSERYLLGAVASQKQQPEQKPPTSGTQPRQPMQSHALPEHVVPNSAQPAVSAPKLAVPPPPQTQSQLQHQAQTQPQHTPAEVLGRIVSPSLKVAEKVIETTAHDVITAPKRKRNRKRKKKTDKAESGGTTVAQVERAIEEGVIHLK